MDKIRENCLRDLRDNIKWTNIHIIGIPKYKRKKGTENIFEETMAENYPKLGKEKGFQKR